MYLKTNIQFLFWLLILAYASLFYIYSDPATIHGLGPLTPVLCPLSSSSVGAIAKLRLLMYRKHYLACVLAIVNVSS